MSTGLATDVAATSASVRRMRRRVEALGLDLRGRRVLTEAATGPYAVTPVLAALAGAEVVAYAAASRHASAEQALGAVAELLDAPGLAGCRSRVQLTTTLTADHLADADVVTNSGHLRPLDRAKLRHLSPSAVVALMFEAWEWRGGDLDLAHLRERGIPVVATNEQHPDVDVFGFLGEMAVRLVHEAGRCLHGGRVTLVTNNPFGPYLARTLAALAAEVGVVDDAAHRAGYADLAVEWLGDLGAPLDPGRFRDSEAVLVALYPFERTWVGDDGPVTPAGLAAAFDQPLVLRFAGHVEADDLARAGIEFYPPAVPRGHMGILPSALGAEPIVRLQAGGLRAAQAALEGQFLVAGHPIGEVL